MKIYQATLAAVVAAAALCSSNVQADEAAVTDTLGDGGADVLVDANADVDTSFLNEDEDASAAGDADTVTILADESLALPSPTGASVDDGECTTIEDLACNTDGFSSVCTLVKEQTFPEFTIGFAPTDAAFSKAKFNELPDDLYADFLGFHFSKQEDVVFTPETCSTKIEMTNGRSARLVCDKTEVSTRRVPIYLKGAGNSPVDLPEFNPEAGIAICGGGTIYIIDHVLVSKDYFINEDGGVVSIEDAREEVVVDINDGKDYFKELLIATTSVVTGVNICEGMNPQFPNIDCLGEDGVVDVSEQAGQNVTKGYIGGMESEIVPITDSYYKVGLCPVNVHWHAGAEHYSAGEFDCLDHDKCGPYHGEAHHSSEEDHQSSEEEEYEGDLNATDDSMSEDNDMDVAVAADEEMPDVRQRNLAGDVRVGFQCGNLYDADDEKFTTPYDWQFCDKSMEVGQTYEVHWPHSAAGACGTPNQYQTPFKDGVFCNLPIEAFQTLTPQDIASNVGVQSQTFVIVNDENYYYGNLLGGMIVEGDFGTDMAIYTGSTTGTSVNNEVCSQYTPITWQVDRKCHMISASSFDKMCADMMAQRDDMTDDLYAHGARELVADFLSSNNQVRRERKNLRSRN
mmetsp:Transcript_7303/g.7876  ORF Transcript_7303/g.7876 Transcript_7303/m.7876 type:complete len:626 (-) Transcript_7303:395-2272(-)